MNKKQTMELLVPVLESVLTPLGFKYLKSQEKFACKVEDGTKWIIVNVTYWASSDYCMYSPVVGVHFAKLEAFKAQHLGVKSDPHSPSLSLPLGKKEGGEFWTLQSSTDVNTHSAAIETNLMEVCLPSLNRMADRETAVSMVLDRTYDRFMNEYHRLVFLFSYVGAYGTTDLVERIVESYDPSRSPKSQQTQFFKDQLNKLKNGVSEIERIPET